jgi:uncharacterized membrane protein YhaH (DUF805 family)
MKMMFVPLRRAVDFKGRSRRAEYWQFVGFFYAVMICFYLAIALVRTLGLYGPDLFFTSMFGLAFLVLLLPLISVSMRRLHDTNRSGWLLLLNFIPMVGGIFLLVLSLLDGTKGSNAFGPDPKGR